MKFVKLLLPCLAAGVLSGPWALPSPAAAAELRVLLMVVDGNPPIPRQLRHYENNQVTNLAWTDVSTLHDFAFERDSSFASLFDEMSYGQVTLTGDTLAMAFPQAASDLTWTQWTALADAEAASRGFPPSSYDRLLYVLPYLPKDAPAVGLSLGPRGWCAFLSYVELGCLFHELSHTLGMQHAGELLPGGGSNGLGDDSDGLMGSAFNAHVNAVNKLLAGWLSGSRLQVFDQPGSQSFVLAAQSATADALQVIRVQSPGADPELGVVDTFVSFRDSGGHDRQLLSSLPDLHGDAVADAVVVHQWPRFAGGDTLYRAALEAGESFEENGVSVRVDAIAGSHATMTVSRAPYYPSPPQAAVAPGSAASNPGGYRFFTLSLTNTNDPYAVPFDCHYDVTLPAIGAGWLAGWTSFIETTVPPGETREFGFLVAAPYVAAPGTYPFSLTVTDPTGDAGPVSTLASASYTVLPEPGLLLELGSSFGLLGILDWRRRAGAVSSPQRAAGSPP